MHGKQRFGMNRRAANPLFKMTRSEGGANPRVKQQSDAAESAAINEQIPWILARIYAPPPIINTDQTRDEGVSAIDRVYLPRTDTPRPRTFTEKFGNWFVKGNWS